MSTRFVLAAKKALLASFVASIMALPAKAGGKTDPAVPDAAAAV